MVAHASLFSGIGGFDLAAEWAGWTNMFNCEIDPFCRRVLSYHFPNAVQYEDIKTTDFTVWRGRIDVLTGGFPLVSKEQAQAVRQIRTTESEVLRSRRLGNGIGALSTRWRYLVDEPYMTSEKCCEMLKKRPFRHYNTSTRSLGMVGTRAGESKLRQSQYIRRGGCNAFDDDPAKVHSAPLSLWTDADIHEYIHRYDVPYCELYDAPGVTRTGCVFCGFGAYESPARFHLLRERYPKLYDMCMGYTNNGCSFRYALWRMGINLP